MWCNSFESLLFIANLATVSDADGERGNYTMPKTEEFLRAAFAGESQTNRKYLAFAATADQEGYPQVARLFRGAAESETVHAHNYLRALKGVRSTKENLQEAISVETNAFKNLYPEMIETARAEGNKEAEMFFQYALESEKIHAQLFQKLLDTLGTSKENYSYYICPGCGHTMEKVPPGACPVCGTKGGMYRKTD
jgi:rubrerythrin